MRALESNNKNLGKIPKNQGFLTPDNYFDNLDSLILAKLKAEALNANESASKIPENYFDDLNENITKKIKLSKRNNKTKKAIKILAPISIAASLFLALFFNQFKQQPIDFDTVTTEEIEFAIANGYIDFDAQTLAVAFSEIDLSDDFMSLEISTDEVQNYLENQEIEYLLYEN